MRAWIAACALLLACSEQGSTSVEGCTTLDYENFGQHFVGEYCVDCHSDVGSESELRAAARSIELEVVTLRTMPPASSTAQPSATERQLLGEWFQCGAP